MTPLNMVGKISTFCKEWHLLVNAEVNSHPQKMTAPCYIDKINSTVQIGISHAK